MIHQELDRLHAQYELYHIAVHQLDLQERFDLTHKEFKLIFNGWIDARQHGGHSSQENSNVTHSR